MECTRSKRKGEVECSKSSHIQEGRKSFYNGGEEGGKEIIEPYSYGIWFKEGITHTQLDMKSALPCRKARGKGRGEGR